jgi:hypothetical protein
VTGSSFHAWRAADLSGGVHLGTAAGARGLELADPVGSRAYDDPHADGPRRRYSWAAWLSPEVAPGDRFTRLVPSWNARTPADSWLEVEARVSPDGLRWSRWFCLGRWAEGDGEIHPTSVPGQGDEHTAVSTDEVVARGTVDWASFQLRVTLLRPPGSTAVPTVSLVGAVVSGHGPALEVAPGAGPGRGTVLPVPAYSQQLHRGRTRTSTTAASPGAPRRRPAWCSAPGAWAPTPASSRGSTRRTPTRW